MDKQFIEMKLNRIPMLVKIARTLGYTSEEAMEALSAVRELLNIIELVPGASDKLLKELKHPEEQ